MQSSQDIVRADERGRMLRLWNMVATRAAVGPSRARSVLQLGARASEHRREGQSDDLEIERQRLTINVCNVKA